MDEVARKLLARHYGYARGADKKRGPLTATERRSLAGDGFLLEKVPLSHDEFVRRLVRAVEALDARVVCGAFLPGVSGRFLRGRQPLISYAYGRHMTAHRAMPRADNVCQRCGYFSEPLFEHAELILRLHLGFVWNEGVYDYLFDLEELATIAVPQPSAEDRRAVAELLRTIEASPAELSPSALEKQLSSEKLLPHTDKYSRYGLLEALAEVGVLPNPLVPPTWDRFVTFSERIEAAKMLKVSHRSDIVLPFGAWRGSCGVEWARAKALFGVSRPS